mgnify:CR=1 FL=1
MSTHPINNESVRFALACHSGKASGIHARDLVREILGGCASAHDERVLRSCIEALRNQGLPICGTPASGYFMAENPEELDETCELLLSRICCTSRQVARMRGVAEPDLRGQLNMPLEPAAQ